MVAFDLGSNTLRAVKIDCETKERVKEYEKIVKTADGLQESGEIKKITVEKIVEAIKEAKKMIDTKDEEIVAVATAALRIASNSEKVLKIIKKETGVEFKVISGTEEANYTALAVSERLKKLKLQNEDFILLDLGGGSSEIYIKKEQRSFIKSFPLGIVTLTQKYNSVSDVKESLENETKEIRKFVDEIYRQFSKPKLFVSTAGTATTLASFKLGIDYEHYDHTKVTGVVLNTQDIDQALQKLLSMSEEERNRWAGVGRSDFIISGISILKKILKITEFDEMVVIDDGLREGVAIDKCNELTSNII
jgi:exopolyphosphatase/guanosine-5'-triphosphate,3'-diphosphate pyrophosphatase